MADNFDKAKPVIRNDMFGRLDIYSTFDEITEDNVVEELNSALVFHIKNMLQEEFLYWYARGVQPILNRSKDIREDILNIVQVNTAASIVDFKNGYLITQPLTYVSRRKGVQTKVKKLNEYLYRSGKMEVDNKVADWFHRVGKGVCFVEPSDECTHFAPETSQSWRLTLSRKTVLPSLMCSRKSSCSTSLVRLRRR